MLNNLNVDDDGREISDDEDAVGELGGGGLRTLRGAAALDIVARDAKSGQSSFLAKIVPEAAPEAEQQKERAPTPVKPSKPKISRATPEKNNETSETLQTTEKIQDSGFMSSGEESVTNATPAASGGSNVNKNKKTVTRKKRRKPSVDLPEESMPDERVAAGAAEAAAAAAEKRQRTEAAPPAAPAPVPSPQPSSLLYVPNYAIV
jgi:hypothetical protein